MMVETLIERLRAHTEAFGIHYEPREVEVCIEAADRLEAAERELKEARAERETWAKNALDNDDCRQMWQARAEAAERQLAERDAALRGIRLAIMEADPSVLTDTFWMPDSVYKGGTVVDFIDAALGSGSGGWRTEAETAMKKTLEYLRGQDAQGVSGGHRNGDLRARIKWTLLGCGGPLRDASPTGKPKGGA